MRPEPISPPMEKGSLYLFKKTKNQNHKMTFPALLRELGGDERNPQSYQEFWWQLRATQDFKNQHKQVWENGSVSKVCTEV